MKGFVTATRGWAKEAILGDLDLANEEVLDEKMYRVSIKDEEKALFTKKKRGFKGKEKIRLLRDRQGKKGNPTEGKGEGQARTEGRGLGSGLGWDIVSHRNAYPDATIDLNSITSYSQSGIG